MRRKERGRVAAAEIGKRGEQRQAHREDVAGWHGAGPDQIHQRVALDASDALCLPVAGAAHDTSPTAEEP